MPAPENTQTHSNNSLAKASKLFEHFWPFCEGKHNLSNDQDGQQNILRPALTENFQQILENVECK